MDSDANMNTDTYFWAEAEHNSTHIGITTLKKSVTTSMTSYEVRIMGNYAQWSLSSWNVSYMRKHLKEVLFST